MKTTTSKRLLTLLMLYQYIFEAHSTSGKRQLKDVQVKIPMQIRARRYCTDADCIKTCPIDFELDNEQQYCRYKRSACPANYIRRHGSCVLSDIQCPPGSVRQGNRCVVQTLECPSGYMLKGNNCVNARYCPEGYHWENGFCYHQPHTQICPNGYENKQGKCIQICVNCDSACADCEEENVSLKCPAGYELYRGQCLKVVQGRADVVLINETYRVPVECENDDVYNNGFCMRRKFESPQCDTGSFYAGKCVEVARCSQGILSSDCECLVESTVPAVCRQGQPGASGCVVSKSQCRKPAQLVNGFCQGKLDSHRALCASGTPLDNMYCTTNPPACPSGFVLDGSFCTRNVSYPVDCGRFQWFDGWCSSSATCESGYKLQANGDCVREMRTQKEPCPASTTYDGEHCVSNDPLCEPGHEYDERYGICVRCMEQPAVCDSASGYQLNNGTCVRYDPLCPPGFKWKNNHCESSLSKYVECQSGQLVDHYCVHSHLNCPDNQELIDGVCVHQEVPSCPEGSVYQDGLCVAAKQCPPGYIVGQYNCVEETRTAVNTSVQPGCRHGFKYEKGNCIKAVRTNAVVDSRPVQCPIGYTLINGKCIKEYRGILVCPPKTIHMNQENKCFCKVDLVCPNGYERMGEECIFRSTNYYSPYLNFLNPCHGIQCSLQYCMSQCFSPPCPVQPCSYGTQHFNSVYGGGSQTSSDICGIGETCTTNEQQETVVSLICPPGYTKKNNTCIAFYNRICQGGYKLIDGVCFKYEEVDLTCPLGYLLTNGTCSRLHCDAGYAREGTTCTKTEYHSPLACPKNYVYIEGICLHRNDCPGGSVEGNQCVRRRYDQFRCPPRFTQINDSCVLIATCASQGLLLTNGLCRSTSQVTLRCPPDTKRVKDMCVFDRGIKFEKNILEPSRCEGRVLELEDLCAYIETPSCGKGYVLKNGRCVTCASTTPHCPSGMVIINRKCIKYHKPCKDGWYLTKEGQCLTVTIRSAKCTQGTISFNRCIQSFPTCKSGYTIFGNMCVRKETVLAKCNESILVGGTCVSLLQCNGPDFSMSNGWCERNEYSEPTCNSRTARLRDICISGNPKCPENYYQLNGQCCSYRVQHAECSNNARCQENFCPASYPSCSSSFNFDGSVCTKVISHSARCPAGTTPVSGDRDYCQYSTEQANFYCPDGYNHKNGICQKRQYVEASCPSGFRRKLDVCVRKVCNNAALTVYCGTQGQFSPSLSPAIHVPHFPAPRPFNATTSSVTPNEVCCQIHSPRICKFDETADEWNCHHTENRRCGSFCHRPDQHIYLRTSESYYLNDVLILVPPEFTAENEIEDFDENYDYLDDTKPSCDGCTDRSYDCDSYCYTYDCQKSGSQCDFKEQRVFCSAHPGPGCTINDGCYSRDYCIQ